MLGWALVMLVTIPPLAFLFLHRPPEVPTAFFREGTAEERRIVLGLRPNTVLAIISHRRVLLLRSDGDPAGPSRRLLQRCRDPGGAGRGDAVGAAGRRLSSRMFWGWLSDRIGGL
jgi:hypothetical protein